VKKEDIVFDVRWQKQGREGSWQNNCDGCVEMRMRGKADRLHRVCMVHCSSYYHDMSAIR
jgi:hypothetical protein